MGKFGSYLLTGLKSLISGLVTALILWVVNTLLVLFGIGAGIMGMFNTNIIYTIVAIMIFIMFLMINLFVAGWINQQFWRWK